MAPGFKKNSQRRMTDGNIPNGKHPQKHNFFEAWFQNIISMLLFFLKLDNNKHISVSILEMVNNIYNILPSCSYKCIEHIT